MEGGRCLRRGVLGLGDRAFLSGLWGGDGVSTSAAFSISGRGAVAALGGLLR
jgi:hypothetical protein